jgi:hypothetical protein
MKRFIVVFPLLIILTGCFGDQVLTRRYKSMVWDTKPPKELIILDAISIDPPSAASPAQPAILSLSDRGQASYIDAVKESDDIVKIIAKPFPKKKSKSMTDRTTLKKAVLFSVMKKDSLLITSNDPITEADRISKLELKLTRADDWYRLYSWDKLGTVYGTIDLGKVTRESAGSFNAKLSPTFSGSLVGAGEIGGGVSTTFNEELALEARHIAVSGMLSPDEGVIVQQGGLGRDLEGNVSVVLSVKLDGINVNLIEPGQLTDNKGAFKKPTDITLNVIPTRIPFWNKAANPVMLNVSADYTLRHVTKGQESTIEGNHHVTLYKGKIKNVDPIILLNKAKYLKLSQYYLIQDRNKMQVHINSNTQRYNLAFASRDSWDNFKNWLLGLDKSDFPVSIGKGANSWTLIHNGADLKQQDVQNLGAFPTFKKKT